MVAIQSLFVSLIAATAIANPTLRTRDEHKKCLSEHEAEKFATVWLRFWSTGGVKTKADLTPYVTKNIVNADYAFGPPNVGIDALFAATTYVDPLITAVVQTPLDVFNTCDKIAVRWGYTAKSTGVNSTVPAGTHLSMYGMEMLTIDLKSRLISNSSSSADWVNLATQLGQTVVF